MKIGILTFHCAHNYGAVLQAYALQEYLVGLGHEVYIIDYRPSYLVEPFKIFSWKRLPGGLSFVRVLLGESVRLLRYIKRFVFFSSFISRRFHLLKMDPYLLQSSCIDAFIFGSDQIWNKNICGGIYDPVYFGNFAAAHNKKKIAYAASAGDSSITDEELGGLLNSLHSFTRIGLRENNLYMLLASYFPIEKVQLVLDPSLLVQRQVFDKIVCNPLVNSPYVLVYQVHISSKSYNDIIQSAEYIAKQIGGKVIDLSFTMSLFSKIRKNVSVEKFLGYIKYADCVVTNSFHGTSFSIVFERPFYTVKMNSNIDLRVHSLLNDLSLTNRFLEHGEKPSFTSIDYRLSLQKLSSLRHKSTKFIIDSLQCCEEEMCE